MNSLEEVMMEVYRLDYAEFDAPSKHHFSLRLSLLRAGRLRRQDGSRAAKPKSGGPSHGLAFESFADDGRKTFAVGLCCLALLEGSFGRTLTRLCGCALADDEECLHL